MRKGIWTVLATVFAMLTATTNAAAAYPDKPIQLIVPYSAGGSTDVLARAVAQVAPQPWRTRWIAAIRDDCP